MLKLFKKILAVVLVIASVTSMVVKVASNKSLRERQIVLSFWGTNLPYQFALEEVARQYNEMQDKYEVVIDKQDAGNYRTWMHCTNKRTRYKENSRNRKTQRNFQYRCIKRRSD